MSQRNKNPCNCRVKAACPVGGICTSEIVLYEATIFTTENIDQKKGYRGITAES